MSGLGCLQPIMLAAKSGRFEPEVFDAAFCTNVRFGVAGQKLLTRHFFSNSELAVPVCHFRKGGRNNVPMLDNLAILDAP